LAPIQYASRAATLIEEAAPLVFPTSILALTADYAPDLLNDIFHEATSNEELLKLAECCRSERPTSLHLRGRSDLDDATLTVLLNTFPSIQELNIQNCTLQGDLLADAETFLSLVPELRVLKMALTQLHCSLSHLTFPHDMKPYMMRGITIDLIDPADPYTTGLGMLGITASYLRRHGREAELEGSPAPEMALAIATGSWTPHDIICMFTFEYIDHLRAIFASPHFKINSPINQHGLNALHTAALSTSKAVLELVLQQPDLDVNARVLETHPLCPWGTALDLAQREASDPDTADARKMHTTTVTIPLLRQHGAKTGAELDRGTEAEI